MSGNEYVQEFINITQYLLNSKKVPVRGEFILVPKEIIEKMLQHNNFDTPDGKLRVWKSLHWIDCDEGRMTKKVSIQGKRKRMLKMDIKVYQTLADLFIKDVQ